jgi:hypothetical protein
MQFVSLWEVGLLYSQKCHVKQSSVTARLAPFPRMRLVPSLGRRLLELRHCSCSALIGRSFRSARLCGGSAS